MTSRSATLEVKTQGASARTGSESAISVSGLSHTFGDKVALAPDLKLELGDLGPTGGGVIGLLGPNGSGKSTLMRILVGLVPKQSGDVTVDGARLTRDGLEVRRRVTYAPGELHLYSELSGRAQLDFLLRGRDAGATERAVSIANDLGLPLTKRVRGYSHGMKRQLIFAAAMGPDVRVRILDEISEGLDPTKRSEILERLEADARRGTTILLSSHHLGEVDRACERIVFLNDGRLIADETSEDVRQRAARLVKVRFTAGHSAPLGPQLEGPEVESVMVDGDDVRVLLRSQDPREFLARMSRNDALPAPVAIEHGRMSLRELYRSLYGVEGT